MSAGRASICVGLGFVGVALGISLLIAVAAIDDMRTGESCVGPYMSFEVERVEQVTTDWWPPGVRCEVEMADPYDDVVQRESRWRIYSPVPFAVVLAIGVLGLLMTRDDDETPSEPQDPPGPS